MVWIGLCPSSAVTKRFAQSGDLHGQVAVLHRLAGPDRVVKFIPADDAAIGAQQCQQQVERTLAERHLCTVALQLPRSGV